MTRNLSQIRNSPFCIDSCLQASRWCSDVRTKLSEALVSEGLLTDERTDLLNTLQMCAKICQLTAQALELRSDLDVRLSLLCADICLQCADMCEQAEKNQEDESFPFSAAAAACFACARACRMMSSNPSSFVPLYSDIRLV